MPTNAPLPPTTPKKVLSAIHNLPKRMRSGTFRTHGQAAPPRAHGKENVPPGEHTTTARPPPPPPPQPQPRRRRPAPLLPKSSRSAHASGLDSPRPRSPLLPSQINAAGRWAPKDGQIIIKIWLPSTGDIWKLRVPEGVGLAEFRARVAAKVGFEVGFSENTTGLLRNVADEGAFRRWVARRVVGGRNTPLTALRVVLQ
ncbi:hypothetical protein C8Q76DRAFT_797621 [Earliella scabrosa]|nr:hypothetical protein C8Q76DRAFT_797621 [Earliella scabrosa]